LGTSMKTEYCLSKPPYTIPAIKNTIVTLHFQRKKELLHHIEAVSIKLDYGQWQTL
jgi:hypothetical protein